MKREKVLDTVKDLPQEFELEELQGVSGLKAIRVGINFEYETKTVAEIPQSKTNMAQ